jgi:WD40 repeat protein
VYDLVPEFKFRAMISNRGRAAFSPDGRLLICGDSDGAMRLWDLSGAKPTERFPLTTPVDAVQALAFGAADQLLSSVGYDGAVRSWDFQAAPPQAQLSSGMLNPAFATFARDGRALVERARWGDLRLFTRAGNEWCEWWRVEKGIAAAAFAPDGKTLAVACDDGTVQQWDLSSKKPRQRQSLPGKGPPPLALAYAPDGRRMASADKSGVSLWDLSGPEPRKRDLPLNGIAAVSLVFSPDGRALLAGTNDGRLHPWDTSGAEPQAVGLFSGHAKPATYLAFAPDGSSLASADESGRVVLWETTNWNKQRQWQLPGGIRSLAFAHDSRHLALGLPSGPVYILRLVASERTAR